MVVWQFEVARVVILFWFSLVLYVLHQNTHLSLSGFTGACSTSVGAVKVDIDAARPHRSSITLTATTRFADSPGYERAFLTYRCVLNNQDRASDAAAVCGGATLTAYALLGGGVAYVI